MFGFSFHTFYQRDLDQYKKNKNKPNYHKKTGDGIKRDNTGKKSTKINPLKQKITIKKYPEKSQMNNGG